MGNCEYFSQKIGIAPLREPPLPSAANNRRWRRHEPHDDNSQRCPISSSDCCPRAPSFAQGVRVEECVLAARHDTLPAIKLRFY
jgi:hypothetical protein